MATAEWPTPEEYDDILRQNHHDALYDAGLRRRQLQKDQFGRPLRLNRGGSSYICVYRLDDLIIRCFAADPSKGFSPPSDITTRYRGIVTYQERIGHTLSFLVANILLEQGIRVNGSDFPILKLQYVAGSKRLGDFLAEYYDRYREPAVARILAPLTHTLAQEWSKAIQQFENRRVAHGDLDLSNVLVYGKTPGDLDLNNVLLSGKTPDISLRLIDFDGMYVPLFAGQRMGLADRGHEHFQPTQDGVRSFNSEMDRFSALIIYLSLCALEMNPSLWDQCQASESRLLLGKSDFARLSQSNRFRLLRQERSNSRLQLCLDELEASIRESRMPRSLQDILGIYPQIMSAVDIPALAPAIPLDLGREDGDTSLSIWQYKPAPPPQPLSVPLTLKEVPAPPPPATYAPGNARRAAPPPPPPIPAQTPARSSSDSSIGCVVAAVIVVVLVALLIWFLVQHNSSSSPQPTPTGFVLQMVLSLPFIGINKLSGDDDREREERSFDDEE